MSRSVRYTSSPLLASRTPVWRSKFVVAAIALAFGALAARAAYIQVYANSFFQRQGEVRFARNLELPAYRGRILDRNGQILASSVPAPSIWAIPDDVDTDGEKAKLQKLAKLLEMPYAALAKKLAEDKTFVWVNREPGEKPQRQEIVTGVSDDTQVEIVSGLSTDDNIVEKTTPYEVPKKASAGSSPFMPTGGRRGH